MADPELAKPAQGAPEERRRPAGRGAQRRVTRAPNPVKEFWRGGRVAEGAPLLRAYRVKPIEGSNPSLSAICVVFIIKINELRTD